MKNFRFVSFILLILCAYPLPSKSANSGRGIYLSRDHSTCFASLSFDKALFKASLDIRKQHLSGFLLIKRTSDTSHRIVFANEIGMTLFDFAFHQEAFQVHYIFEPLNKKALVRIFEKDFRQLIFGTESGKNNPFTKTKIQIDSVKGTIPEEIRLSNPGIKLFLKLQLMRQQK